MHTRLEGAKSLLLFFALAYAISWSIWAPLYLPAWNIEGLPVLPYHHALGGLGPLIAGFIVTRRYQGRADVDLLFRAMLRWRPLPILMVVILTPFVLVLAGQTMSYLQQGR